MTNAPQEDRVKSYCDNCGSNPWFAKEFPRVRDDAAFWRREAEKLAARVGQLELAAKHQDHRDRTDVSWLQSKVTAQARELKRLNDQRNVDRIKSGLDPMSTDVVVSSITKVEVDSCSTNPSNG